MGKKKIKEGEGKILRSFELKHTHSYEIQSKLNEPKNICWKGFKVRNWREEKWGWWLEENHQGVEK